MLPKEVLIAAPLSHGHFLENLNKALIELGILYLVDGFQSFIFQGLSAALEMTTAFF